MTDLKMDIKIIIEGVDLQRITKYEGNEDEKE